MTKSFLSPSPQVTLLNCFDKPYSNAVATARTCYSGKGIVTAEQVAYQPELRDRIAFSVYQAGHHTTLQHAHVQFGLANVSRQFIWSFLHAHPFYNSEQVSQRYVKTNAEAVFIPHLEGEALRIYLEAIEEQARAYHEINELLQPTVREFYYDIFPARTPKNGSHTIAKRTIPKKTQEIGRYVLPVATFAYLYHTVSVLTLMRYYRLCRQFDVPSEQYHIVHQMVKLLLDYDPLFEKILQEPLALDETIEYRYFMNVRNNRGASRAFREEFDASLEGFTSKLISFKPDNEALLAGAVREVLGVARSEMSDSKAIGLVLDPQQNPYFGESLNITSMSKLTRTMVHPHYTFRKKLSHTADSQDQRHRMTPGSRPTLQAYLSNEPDYITPSILTHHAPLRQRYDEAMNDSWLAISKLRELGVKDEVLCYLLPNAVSIRFSESADLLSLHHKLRMRLCYNAQEEIFAASKDEALQIQQVNPLIGQYLGAPCTARLAAKVRPYCPEGDRYCGVPVWKLQIKQYQRIL